MRHDESAIAADTYSDEHFEFRRGEVVSELHKICQKLGIDLDAGVVVEIGAGSGSETAGLRDFFPQASIIAVDIDERVHKGYASDYADQVIVSDVLDVLDDPKETSSLFGGVDVVTALRTRAAIAKELIKKLSQSGFRGTLVASFIDESERDQESRAAVSSINRMALQGEVRSVALKEGRGHNERAYIKSFADDVPSRD